MVTGSAKRVSPSRSCSEYLEFGQGKPRVDTNSKSEEVFSSYSSAAPSGMRLILV